MQKELLLAKDFLLSSFPNAISLYVFGSRITDNAHVHSDLDLAILVPGYADPITLWEASNHLASLVKMDVDLLDLRAASTVMQYQVITTGKQLYGESLDAQLFELYVLKEKLYLDRLRGQQLKQIAQEGKIYA